MWKNGLVWHSSPLWMFLAIWAKFGSKRANISEGAWETPIFLLSPRLYLPIGIWNCPYFGWDPLFDFWLGSIFSQDTCVPMPTLRQKMWSVFKYIPYFDQEEDIPYFHYKNRLYCLPVQIRQHFWKLITFFS